MSYYAKAPVGATYGRWTVIAHGGPNKLLCRCECGTERAVDRSSLRNGTSTSCGCWRKEFLSRLYTTHGQSRTRLYRVWAAMVERCTVPSNKQYVNYGGRGISVHPEWFDFAKYKAYVDSLPKPNGTQLSLDREDNDGNYEPGNLRWATDERQARNTRQASRRVLYKGQEVHPYDVCDAEGFSKSALKRRLLRGESPEAALDAMRLNRKIGFKRPDRLQITFEGATKDVSEWAAQLGVHPGTLRYRLKRVAEPGHAVAYYAKSDPSQPNIPTLTPGHIGVTQAAPSGCPARPAKTAAAR